MPKPFATFDRELIGRGKIVELTESEARISVEGVEADLVVKRGLVSGEPRLGGAVSVSRIKRAYDRLPHATPLYSGEVVP